MYTNPHTDAGLAAAAGLALALIPVILTVWVVQLIAQWRLVNKMGGRGWSQVVPVYASWELASSAGCERAKCVAYTAFAALETLGAACAYAFDMDNLALPAIAMLVMHIIVMNRVAERFGKGRGFTAGLVLLPVVFVGILGFGQAMPAGVDAGEPRIELGPSK